jgi:hypothetical protein
MTTARAAKRFKAALRGIKRSCPRRLAATSQVTGLAPLQQTTLRT